MCTLINSLLYMITIMWFAQNEYNYNNYKLFLGWDYY